jgi:hypothetical protein
MEQAMMQKAFELVTPEKWGAKDWRCAINAYVTAEELEKAGVTIAEVVEAIAFMTATEANVHEYNLASATPGRKGFHVTAKGYRAGPAGP